MECEMKGRKVILLGGGQHAGVLIEALCLTGVKIIGIIDPAFHVGDTLFGGIPVINHDESISKQPPDTIQLVNAVGPEPYSSVHMRLFNDYVKKGYRFASVVHPSAVIASNVVIEAGVQIMAGAVIQPGVVLKENSVVNTRSSVDHDCFIGSHSHIAPGVTLSGAVKVGSQTFIGTGTSVIQKISIGQRVLIGAGSVVIHDIQDNMTAHGVPAKPILVKKKMEMSR